ncbi:MAG: APC family permease [Solirubrobacterales bacterium]
MEVILALSENPSPVHGSGLASGDHLTFKQDAFEVTDTDLRAGALTTWQVVVLSAATVGPAAGVALNFQFVATFARAALPLAFVVAAVVIMLMANTVVQFTRRLTHAGSYYAYASFGLNRETGFVAAWAIAFGYLVAVPAGLNLFGYTLSSYVATQWNVAIGWEWFFVLGLGLVVLLAYLGVQGSARAAMLLLAFEIIVLAALAVTILVKVGVSNWSAAPFRFSSAPDGVNGVALGLVYALLSIIGWEAGATFSEETKDPKRTVGRGVFGAAALCAGFFLLTGYAATMGFGVDAKGVAAFQNDPTPLQTLTTTYWSSGALFLTVLAAASSILGFVLAAFNAAARMLYALAREGLLPRPLSRVNASRKTPSVAILGYGVVALGAGLAFGLGLEPVNVWGYFGFMIATAILFVYMVTNLSLVVATYRRGELTPTTALRNVLLPIVAACFIGYVFKNLFYPVPAMPYRIFPYIVIGVIVLGAVYVTLLRRRAPEVVAEAGEALAGE